MKKRIMLMLLGFTMAVSLAACGGTQDKKDEQGKKAEQTDENADDSAKLEKDHVTFNVGNSGNVLFTIAEEKGYFKEEGITVELINSTANADAMTMLATGKVDVVTNSGTSNPLQQIGAGVDLTMFGGHMVTGCMPVIAKEGTEWKGVESLIGKKFACNPSYFAFTGAVMDLGYEDPLEAVEWLTITDYNDAMAAVLRGEADFALQGTGQNYNVKNTDGIEIVCYQSDVMRNYSCCRMEALTSFVDENPNTIKAVLRALVKAQAEYEKDREAAAKMHAEKIGTDIEYVEAYMLDEEHYKVSVDPLKNSIVRAWEILGKTGFLDEEASKIDINDHINTELYEEVLAEMTEKYGAENPEFYEGQNTFYEENNK